MGLSEITPPGLVGAQFRQQLSQVLPVTLIREEQMICSFRPYIREIFLGHLFEQPKARGRLRLKALLLAVLTSHLQALGDFVSRRYDSWRAAPRSADFVPLTLTHALCTHAAPRTRPTTASNCQDGVQARPTEEARRGASSEARVYQVRRHDFDDNLHVVPRPRQWGRLQARPPSRPQEH